MVLGSMDDDYAILSGKFFDEKTKSGRGEDELIFSSFFAWFVVMYNVFDLYELCLAI